MIEIRKDVSQLAENNEKAGMKDAKELVWRNYRFMAIQRSKTELILIDLRKALFKGSIDLIKRTLKFDNFISVFLQEQVVTCLYMDDIISVKLEDFANAGDDADNPPTHLDLHGDDAENDITDAVSIGLYQEGCEEK